MPFKTFWYFFVNYLNYDYIQYDFSNQLEFNLDFLKWMSWKEEWWKSSQHCIAYGNCFKTDRKPNMHLVVLISVLITWYYSKLLAKIWMCPTDLYMFCIIDQWCVQTFERWSSVWNSLCPYLKIGSIADKELKHFMLNPTHRLK